MPNLAVIQLMRVIKWPRSDSDGSYVKINVRGNKGFYSNYPSNILYILILHSGVVIKSIIDPDKNLSLMLLVANLANTK